MLLTSYNEFSVAEKVQIKNEVIYELLISNFNSLDQMPVFDYVMRNKNLLTIKSIEHNPKLILQVNFLFTECDGHLYYGQFIKYLPPIYVVTSADFQG